MGTRSESIFTWMVVFIWLHLTSSITAMNPTTMMKAKETRAKLEQEIEKIASSVIPAEVDRAYAIAKTVIFGEMYVSNGKVSDEKIRTETKAKGLVDKFLAYSKLKKAFLSSEAGDDKKNLFEQIKFEIRDEIKKWETLRLHVANVVARKRQQAKKAKIAQQINPYLKLASLSEKRKREEMKKKFYASAHKGKKYHMVPQPAEVPLPVSPVAGPSSRFSPVAGPSSRFSPVAGPSSRFSTVAGPSSRFSTVAGPSSRFSPVRIPISRHISQTDFAPTRKTHRDIYPPSLRKSAIKEEERVTKVVKKEPLTAEDLAAKRKATEEHFRKAMERKRKILESRQRLTGSTSGFLRSFKPDKSTQHLLYRTANQFSNHIRRKNPKVLKRHTSTQGRSLTIQPPLDR